MLRNSRLAKWADYLNHPEKHLSKRMKLIVSGILGGLFQLFWIYFNFGTVITFLFTFFFLLIRFAPKELVRTPRRPIKEDGFQIFFIGGIVTEILAILRFFLLGGTLGLFLQVIRITGLWTGSLITAMLVLFAIQWLVVRRKKLKNLKKQSKLKSL